MVWVLVSRAVVGGVNTSKIVGGIVLEASNWPWAPRVQHLTNAHFYVAPAYRRFGGAQALLEKAQRRAFELQAALRLQINFPSEEMAVLLKDRFVRQAGFRQIGGNFIFIPPAPPQTPVAAPIKKGG